MSSWRMQWTSALPRSAVVLHDLVMVWLCWLGLHYLGFSMIGAAPVQPWWSV
jgi:hypothetical protein